MARGYPEIESSFKAFLALPFKNRLQIKYETGAKIPSHF
jgi:hypothetical protein